MCWYSVPAPNKQALGDIVKSDLHMMLGVEKPDRLLVLELQVSTYHHDLRQDQVVEVQMMNLYRYIIIMIKW